MTEPEIKTAIELITKSFSKANDEAMATPEDKAAVISLLGQIIIDINRAADALEKLSKRHGASE